jgi:hypothetical protein
VVRVIDRVSVRVIDRVRVWAFPRICSLLVVLIRCVMVRVRVRRITVHHGD